MITTAVILWGLFVLVAGLVAYARLIEPNRVVVHQLSIAIPHLPLQLEGLRIAHLSDFHSRPQRSAQRLVRRAVRQTRHQEPDLVLITGDLSHGTDNIDCVVPLIADLDAKYGVYAVLGNHDWNCTLGAYLYGPSDSPVTLAQWRQALAQTNVQILENTSRRLVIDEQVVVIAGVGDPCSGHDDLPAAIEGTEPAGLKIMLAHSPDVVDLPQADWADLILAGHTHGGQCQLPGIGSPWAPVWRFRRRAAGLMQFDNTLLYVSRGVGAGVEARFLCPPEVTIMTLTRGHCQSARPLPGYHQRTDSYSPTG